MPLRELPGDDLSRIYRSFPVGDLADVILLDTRHVARDPQVLDACNTEQLNDPARTLLGAAQEGWLFEQLDVSLARGARWRLIGQQVMMGQLVNVIVQPPCAFNTDQWDGYAASRTRLLAHLEERAIHNVVVLTGDIHTSWAIDLSFDPFDPAVYEPASGSGSLAVELVTPAVTSAGIEDPLLAAQLTALVGMTHGHVKFVDLTRRGYLLLDITPERVQAEWYFLQTILEPDPGEELAAVFEVRAGENRLTATGVPAPAPG
jgi:alkaline phosphatase D